MQSRKSLVNHSSGNPRNGTVPVASKSSSKAGVYRAEETKWERIQDVMIDAMIRLERALSPYLKELEQ